MSGDLSFKAYNYLKWELQNSVPTHSFVKTHCADSMQFQS
jgi:hypothetical protein